MKNLFLLVLALFPLINCQAQRADEFLDLGDKKLTKHDYQGAIDDYTKSIARNPHALVAYENRASAKSMLKDYKGAIEDISFALKNNNLNATLYAERAYFKICEKDYAGAIKDANSGIGISNACFDAYLQRGKARDSLRDFLGALSDFNKVIVLSPGFEQGYLYRGIVKDSLKDYKGAVQDFTKAINFNNELEIKYKKGNETSKVPAPYFYNRGFAKLKLGGKDKGCPDFEKAAELGDARGSKMLEENCR